MFKKLLKSMEDRLGGDKQKNRFRWVLLLGSLGVGVMIFSSFIQVDQIQEDMGLPPMKETTATPATSNHVSTMQEYEKQYEEQLSQVLSKIVGVSDVSVIVNLDSTEEEVVQFNERQSQQVTTETDKSGGNRSISQNTDDRQTAYYRTGNGEEPVIIKKLKPKVRGVLVVARGVENLQVKAIVIEAIQRTLDVPMHRISVLPKE